MQTPFLGQVLLTPYNFAPRGWAFCNGQILAIAQNTALFSLLGTSFGGNGQTTFALPNLQSRVPLGTGQGDGLSDYSLGEQVGAESVTLTNNEMPAHTHQPNCVGRATADQSTPVNNAWGSGKAANDNIYGSPPTAAMSPLATSTSGGGQPHENRQPYLALNYIIALQGIYPARS